MKEIKKCTICGEPLTGRQIKCCSDKICQKEVKKRSNKRYNENNKEVKKRSNKRYNENNKEEIREQRKQFREDNKEKVKKQKKQYRDNNKEKIKKAGEIYREKYKEEVRERKIIYYKQYKKNNIEKVREKSRREWIKKKENVIHIIHGNISCNMRHHLKSNNLSKNGRKAESLIINTFQEIKEHLEKNFLTGMSWDNYGINGWHIDHIIPKEFFKFTSTDDIEFKYCWSKENLQPLWRKDNLEKSDKVMLWGKEIRASHIERDYFLKIKY